MQEGHVVDIESIKPGRDAPEVFEFVEASFHPIAFPVDRMIIADFAFAG